MLASVFRLAWLPSRRALGNDCSRGNPLAWPTAISCEEPVRRVRRAIRSPADWLAADNPSLPFFIPEACGLFQPIVNHISTMHVDQPALPPSRRDRGNLCTDGPFASEEALGFAGGVGGGGWTRTTYLRIMRLQLQ